jgi:hypothetical protein
MSASASRETGTAPSPGDFDLWPGSTGKGFLRVVDSTCEQSEVQLFVVLGNREDYIRV